MVRVEREMQPAAMVCSTAGLLVVGLLTAGLRMAAPRLSAISCGVGEASRAHPPPFAPLKGRGGALPVCLLSGQPYCVPGDSSAMTAALCWRGGCVALCLKESL